MIIAYETSKIYGLIAVDFGENSIGKSIVYRLWFWSQNWKSQKISLPINFN